jgi:predicted ATPase/DNA-binding SARP family transcriptional activator
VSEESPVKGEPHVRVQLLGPFGMVYGSTSAGPWPRTSAKRLLTLVFLSPGHRISKEVASDALFRDLAPGAATNALYNALSAARAVLAELGGPAKGMISTDRTYIYIPSDAPVEVDLEVHEGALSDALRMEPGDGSDTALVEALSENRTLLEDEAYSDWALRPRERLELSRQEARSALARNRSSGFGRSAPKELIGAWEDYAAHDPASEEAAVALMDAYAAQGQRQLVARAFRHCCDGLKDLGLEASADLKEAVQRTSEKMSPVATPRPAEVVGRAGDLPASLSSFVGREAEQAEVGSLVQCYRLVTVTGAGGSGKTRLALEVATRFLAETGGGAIFVDLGPVAEPVQVPSALASVLGVREQAGRPLLEVLCEALAGQDLLVVVDNCEHVMGAAAELADRLHRACRKLRLLATAREPLAKEGEQVYRLAPLSLPPEDASSPEDLYGSDAVELFVQRARSHDSSFALEEPIAGLVASICRRLDGIPLALELAAARVPGMSLRDLGQRLDQRFRLLTAGPRTALPRQRTLQATFDWSFQLLSPGEQVVLTRLSVFSGSFELDAAEIVCSIDAVRVGDVADLIGSLVNRSLVLAERSAGSLRYSLLETVRQYGAEQLVTDGDDTELQRARTAHAEHYLQVAERAEPMILGADQARWLKKLDLDWDNLRSALGHLLSGPGRAEDVLRMGASLVYFLWVRRKPYGFDAVRTALERPEAVPDAVRAKALCCAGFYLAETLGWESDAAVQAGKAMMHKGLEMSRRLGDRALTAEVLSGLSLDAEFTRDAAGAARYAAEALEIGRSLGDDRLVGNALGFLAQAAVDPARKRPLFTQSVAHSRRAGNLVDCCWRLLQLAILDLADGDLESAAALLEGARAIYEEVDHGSRVAAWAILADTRVLQGRFAEAAIWKRKVLLSSRRVGVPAVADFPTVICCVGRLGHPAEAARLAGAAQLAQRLGLGWAADVLPLALAVRKTEVDDTAPAAIVGPVDAAIARRAPAASTGQSSHWGTSSGCQSIYVGRLGCRTPLISSPGGPVRA